MVSSGIRGEVKQDLIYLGFPDTFTFNSALSVITFRGSRDYKPMRAMASESFLLFPPLSFQASLSANSASPTASRTTLTLCSTS